MSDEFKPILETWLETQLSDKDAEISKLCEYAASAKKALEPFANIICLVDKDDESKGYAFDSWADDRVVFSVGNRTITAGDLRHARTTIAEMEKIT
jgi:hypothetical protein